MQYSSNTFPNVIFEIYIIIRVLKVHKAFKEKRDHKEKDIQDLR